MKLSLIIPSIAILVALASGPVVVFAQDEAAANAYGEAYELVMEGDWDAAADALAGFLRQYRESPWSDDAAYWACFVGEKMNDDAESVFTCYKSFTETHRRSNWTDDAKAGMIRLGRQLARAGNPEYGEIVKTLQQSDDEEVALSALYALQNIGDEEALATILNLYENTESSKLKERIVYILGNFDSEEVVGKLADIARKRVLCSCAKKCRLCAG